MASSLTSLNSAGRVLLHVLPQRLLVASALLIMNGSSNTSTSGKRPAV